VSTREPEEAARPFPPAPPKPTSKTTMTRGIAALE
jgi:hypothetical protein